MKDGLVTSLRQRNVEREGAVLFKTCSLLLSLYSAHVILTAALSSPLKLYSEELFSIQAGRVQASPFLLHVDGVVTRGHLHLAGTHRAL